MRPPGSYRPDEPKPPESRRVSQNCIHGGQNRSVAEVFGCLQKRLHLFAAHDDWQLSLVSGEGHTLDADLTVQRVGIQEPQTANNLDISWQRYFLFFDQEQLIFADLLGADSRRRDISSCFSDIICDVFWQVIS